MTQRSIGFLVVHIALWLTLTGKAVSNAGPYSFASCWQIIPLFIWPIGVIILAVACASAMYLLVSVVIISLRHKPGFQLSLHFALMVFGSIVCVLGASLATGPVSCL